MACHCPRPPRQKWCNLLACPVTAQTIYPTEPLENNRSQKRAAKNFTALSQEHTCTHHPGKRKKKKKKESLSFFGPLWDLYFFHFFRVSKVVVQTSIKPDLFLVSHQWELGLLFLPILKSNFSLRPLNCRSSACFLCSAFSEKSWVKKVVKYDTFKLEIWYYIFLRNY